MLKTLIALTVLLVLLGVAAATPTVTGSFTDNNRVTTFFNGQRDFEGHPYGEGWIAINDLPQIDQGLFASLPPLHDSNPWSWTGIEIGDDYNGTDMQMQTVFF